jgi:hypothetical protein
MRSLSTTQKNIILSQLDAGHSTHSIASITGISTVTISRLCSKECSFLQKSTGGPSAKLSSPNICHAIYLISTQKAETAVQMTKYLSNIINKSFHSSITGHYLTKAGMKAIVKSKHFLLSAKYHKACLDFAHAHRDQTLENWKLVIWSDEEAQ